MFEKKWHIMPYYKSPDVTWGEISDLVFYATRSSKFYATRSSKQIKEFQQEYEGTWDRGPIDPGPEQDYF